MIKSVYKNYLCFYFLLILIFSGIGGVLLLALIIAGLVIYFYWRKGKETPKDEDIEKTDGEDDKVNLSILCGKNHF